MGGMGIDVHDHLLSREELVADEFSGAEGDGGVAVCHGDGCEVWRDLQLICSVRI
jgi:hypothetical protein